jgi:outer membrane protein
VLLAVLISMAGQSRAATSLLELYLRAREYDPEFQQAALRRDLAGQGVREARAGVLPVINANAELAETYFDDRATTTTPEPEDPISGQRYSISLTQPLYRASALRRIPQQRADLRRAEAEFLAAEQALMFRLAQAAFNVLSAQDGLEFAIAERAAIERQLEESEQRLGSGLGTLTDVHDARARFAEAQALEIEAQDTLEDARMIVFEITGLLPGDLERLDEAFPLLQPDRPEVESWVQAALFQNLTIRARQEAVEAASKAIRVQKGERWPSLDLVASLRTADSDARTVGDTFVEGDTDTRTGDISLRLGIPVFDGGVRSARVRSAVIRHQISLQELELEKRRVEREARSAFRGVVSGVTRVQALNQAVFSKERAVESKEEAYRSGLDTGLAVLDARRDLFSARRDSSQARYVYLLNTLRLKQSTGTLGVEDLRALSAYMN